MVPQTDPKKKKDTPYTVKDLAKPKPEKGQDYSYLLNPKNWGVENFTGEPSFNQAFKKARKQGLQEFIYNGRRYNTQSNESPDAQMSKFGNLNELLEMNEYDRKTMGGIMNHYAKVHQDTTGRSKAQYMSDFMRLHKENGNPTVQMDNLFTNSSYSPLTNAMGLTREEDYLDELAHAQQNRDGKLPFMRNVKDKLSPGDPYTTPGKGEHEAHSIIAPKLFKQFGFSGPNKVYQDSLYKAHGLKPLQDVPLDSADLAPDEREGGVPWDWDEEAYYDSLEKVKLNKNVPKKADGGVIPPKKMSLKDLTKPLVPQDNTRLDTIKPIFEQPVARTRRERESMFANERDLSKRLNSYSLEDMMSKTDISNVKLPSDFGSKDEYYAWYQKTYGRPQLRKGGKITDPVDKPKRKLPAGVVHKYTERRRGAGITPLVNIEENDPIIYDRKEFTDFYRKKAVERLNAEQRQVYDEQADAAAKDGIIMAYGGIPDFEVYQQSVREYEKSNIKGTTDWKNLDFQRPIAKAMGYRYKQGKPDVESITTPKLQRGGKLVGPSHEQNGIQVFQGGEHVAEVEGGERIFSRKDTQLMEDLISEMSQRPSKKKAAKLGNKVKTMVKKQDANQKAQEMFSLMNRFTTDADNSKEYLEIYD